MASTWTGEQSAKYQAALKEAFDSGLDPAEYWNYIAKKVGDGKTEKDVLNKFHQAHKELYADADLNPRKEKAEESNLEITASTWTEEETRKLGVAYNKAYKEVCESGAYAYDFSEFWEYIAKEVGGGKTVQDCVEKHVNGLIYEGKNKK